MVALCGWLMMLKMTKVLLPPLSSSQSKLNYETLLHTVLYVVLLEVEMQKMAITECNRLDFFLKEEKLT